MSQEQAMNGAVERIAALEAEVRRLRARLADEHLADDLRVRLAQIGAAGTIGAPTEHNTLLRLIVQTAMVVLRARAGSLYLVDETGEALIFEVALGERAVSLLGQRVPLGQGIAGWVAATGQSIAVSDAQHDQRWAREIGQAVGYMPQMMVAIPLLLQDEVVGVLQILDKEDGQPFSNEDMQILGFFGQQAAVAITQSGIVRNLGRLIRAQLATLGTDRDLARRAADLTDATIDSAEYRDILQLAAMIGQLVREGEAGRQLSLDLVGAVHRYLGARR